MTVLGSLLAVAVVPGGGCREAPLEDLQCPCAAGYTCCKSSQGEICLGPEEICVDPASWPPAMPLTPSPAPVWNMDKMTVFAFSQVGMNVDNDSDDDRQRLLRVKPDMVLHAWGQWDNVGIHADDFDAGRIADLQAAGMLVLGGGTATAFFRGQVDDATFDRLRTRDVTGAPVSHGALNKDEYRGSLASPGYRQMIINYGKLQIDKGIDGLQFSDVNASYNGALVDSRGTGDLNEGFDAYHLADFNAFLLAKYAGAEQQLGLPAGNTLRPDVPAGNLKKNFNFARYLREKGWTSYPLSHDDPIVAEWGRATTGMPSSTSGAFVDTAEPYVYWGEIVGALRTYARDNRPADKPFYVSATGVFPYVDFISAGIYDSPEIGQTVFPIETVTTPSGQPGYRLFGEVSVQGWIRTRQDAAERFTPGAPMVVFLEGPWDSYHDLPGDQCQDFWRLYAAEAYANGAFFAFLLKAPIATATDNKPGSFPPSRAEIVPRSADADGTMPLFERLAAFYRGHSDLYHGTRRSLGAERAVTVMAGQPLVPIRVTVSVREQAAFTPDAGDARPGHPARRLVHIINHAYDATRASGSGILPQADVVVTIPVAAPVTAVTIASPDAAGGDVAVLPVPEVAGDGTITVTLPSLDAYSVVIVSY